MGYGVDKNNKKLNKLTDYLFLKIFLQPLLDHCRCHSSTPSVLHLRIQQAEPCDKYEESKLSSPLPSSKAPFHHEQNEPSALW